MMWNPERDVGVDISINTHFFVTSFTTPTSIWIVFNFYDPNTQNGRLSTWDEATNVADSMREGNILCMGEFNTPLYPSEKMGGLEDFSDSMKDLEDFL